MPFGRIGLLDSVGFLDQRQQLRVVLNLRQIRGDDTIQLKMKIGVTNVVDSRRGGITHHDEVAVLIAAHVHCVDRRGQLDVNRHTSTGKASER